MPQSYEKVFANIREKLQRLSDINGIQCDIQKDVFSRSIFSIFKKYDYASRWEQIMICLNETKALDIKDDIYTLGQLGFAQSSELLSSVEDYRQTLIERLQTFGAILFNLNQKAEHIGKYPMPTYKAQCDCLGELEQVGVDKGKILTGYLDRAFYFMDHYVPELHSTEAEDCEVAPEYHLQAEAFTQKLVYTIIVYHQFLKIHETLHNQRISFGMLDAATREAIFDLVGCIIEIYRDNLESSTTYDSICMLASSMLTQLLYSFIEVFADFEECNPVIKSIHESRQYITDFQRFAGDPLFIPLCTDYLQREGVL